MNCQRKAFLTGTLCLLIATVAWPQVSVSIEGTAVNARGIKVRASFNSALGIPIPAIAGAPFTAEQVTEHTQTLSDGTHIQRTGPSSVRLFRDSAGRTRLERSFPLREQTDPAIVLTQVNDPVAGYQYVLDSVNRVAHRLKAPATRTNLANVSGSGGGGGDRYQLPSPVGTPNPNRPQYGSESLGSQVIEGVVVEGKTTTTTIPVGMEGNDRPMTSTSETWFSPELRMTVLSKHTSTASGENTMKLINISRAEPDPALFQVPPDYKVVDEQGPFTVEFTQP